MLFQCCYHTTVHSMLFLVTALLRYYSPTIVFQFQAYHIVCFRILTKWYNHQHNQS